MNEIIVKIKCSINEMIEDKKTKDFNYKKIYIKWYIFYTKRFRNRKLSVREVIIKAYIIKIYFWILTWRKTYY